MNLRARIKGPVILALTVVLFAGEAMAGPAKKKSGGGGSKMAMAITSTAFSPNGKIPSRFTCDGEDASPALNWTGAPAGTKSFALISDDPDAPVGTWVHWVVWNIPPDTAGLPEGVAAKDTLPNGMRQGMTDFQRIGYGGPCPPSGTHRYFFKLYALDSTLDLPARATKAQLEAGMKGHVLAEANLIGLYARGR